MRVGASWWSGDLMVNQMATILVHIANKRDVGVCLVKNEAVGDEPGISSDKKRRD